MKKAFVKIVSVILIIVLMSFCFSGCYGKFNLSKKLYEWNGQAGDKWMSSIIMWILFIVPVYEVVGCVDFVLLNVIEFWTGTNPVALDSDQKETQLVNYEGTEYEITATKNRFDIKKLETDKNSKVISLIFDEVTKSWFVKGADIDSIKIAQINQDDQSVLELIKPDGRIVNVDLDK